MSGAGQGPLRRALAGAVLVLGLIPGIGAAQTQAPNSDVQIHVQADSSGALVPPKAQSPAAQVETGTPPSGGRAPSGGKPASGGGSSSALDYAAWERMAERAETALTGDGGSSVALERLRSQLADWREALLGAQNANSARIATLREQISALGPAPQTGETEADEIAKRRSQLTDQLVRLQAPGIAADEAYRRADGLISEIDRVLRERQANELLKLWPAPINPANWSAAFEALSHTAVTLWSETLVKWGDPAARRSLVDNLPLILVFLAFAVAVLWRGARWIGWLIDLVQGASDARGRRISGFLASLGLIVVPTLGFVALSSALRLSGMLGMVGQALGDSLGRLGFILFASIWLGGRIFPVTQNGGVLLPLSAERRAEGRFLTSSFGVLLVIARVRRLMMDQMEIGDAAASVLNFPIILVGGLLLFRLGQLMQAHLREQALPAEEGKPNYRSRSIGLLARIAMGIGAIGPILAAVGYISAAGALVFPAAVSLGLVALLFLLQRLIADTWAMFTKSDAAEQDALVPVLIGFGLTLATLPLFALIWGARVADLTELWTRFQEGFQLGETRISPTDFLFFAVIFGIGLTLTRLLQGALKSSILPRTGMDVGGQNAVVSGLGYAGILIAALVAINSTGIDLSGLAIVAGALSVGIGFGLQTVVSNFVSGIILLIERPVSEGDWIEVGPVQGTVKSISVRSTRIQTFDRSDVIVPNSDLISGRVTNWTRFSLTGRLIVPVSVPFTTDSRLVECILREIAEAQPLALLSPPPVVALMGFGLEAMNFEIRLILRDVNFSLEVRSEINHQIARRFGEAGILFSNAHRDYLQKLADAAELEAEEEAETRANEAAVAALLGPVAAKALLDAARKSSPDEDPASA